MNVTTDLDARFRAAAVAEGLVDVRYDVVASPVGDLHVAATGRWLCRISYREDDWEERLARGFGVRVLRSPLSRTLASARLRLAAVAALIAGAIALLFLSLTSAIARFDSNNGARRLLRVYRACDRHKQYGGDFHNDFLYL